MLMLNHVYIITYNFNEEFNVALPVTRQYER